MRRDVFNVPLPRVWKGSDAIHAGVNPEIDLHDLSAQFFYSQRFAVDQGPDSLKLRRRVAGAGDGNGKQGERGQS
tara:strand:- start:269 stop:493 length:225 start_codon:yes stop_codon:yes gene_type:complete